MQTRVSSTVASLVMLRTIKMLRMDYLIYSRLVRRRLRGSKYRYRRYRYKKINLEFRFAVLQDMTACNQMSDPIMMRRFINFLKGTGEQILKKAIKIRGFKGEALPYQIFGVFWAFYWQKWIKGGFYADEPGMGKVNFRFLQFDLIRLIYSLSDNINISIYYF